MDYIKDIDKVYVIHCVENEKRLNNINFQKTKNKWLNNKLEIWWTCYHPYSDIMANAMILSGKSRYISNKNELNLVREFYTIIKTSYYKGYNNICIFEDDFSLINEEYFNQFMINIPNDFDIIQLSYLLVEKNIHNINYLLSNNILWIEKNNGGWSNNGIILSRNGMKYFIDFIDNEFVAADIPMHESKNKDMYYGRINQSRNLNHYISSIPLVFVDGYDSTVQNNTKDEIYKLYREQLNKDLYNIYQN